MFETRTNALNVLAIERRIRVFGRRGHVAIIWCHFTSEAYRALVKVWRGGPLALAVGAVVAFAHRSVCPPLRAVEAELRSAARANAAWFLVG